MSEHLLSQDHDVSGRGVELLPGRQPGLELAVSGLLPRHHPLHLLPLLPPREPALAGLQWRGGPRLQVNALDQVKLARCDSNSSSVLVIVILHIMHLDVTHL